MEKTLGASLAKVFGVDMKQYKKSTTADQSKMINKNDQSSSDNKMQQMDSIVVSDNRQMSIE